MAATAANFPLLIPAGFFTCPRCGSSAAVPTAQLVAGFCLAGSPAGTCNRCEHQYQFSVGSPSTTTSGTSNTAGATTLNVASGTAFSTVGAFVVVDSGDVDGGAEVVVSGGAGTSGTIPLNAATPLRLTHAAGTTVQTGTLGPLGPMTLPFVLAAIS
jgi:hypothetical protein